MSTPPTELGSKIIEAIKTSKHPKEIAKELGCSRELVYYYIRERNLRGYKRRDGKPHMNGIHLTVSNELYDRIWKLARENNNGNMAKTTRELLEKIMEPGRN